MGIKKTIHERTEDLKKEAQRKLEQNFWRSIILSVQSLLPDEFAAALGEYTDPKAIEPMLFTVFKMLIKNLDIPPEEFRVIIGYNGIAECMEYGVEVMNVHERNPSDPKAGWRKVKFPMATFMGNVFDSEKRMKTATAMKESILFFRFFKAATDGSETGVLMLENGKPLQ